MKNGSGFKFSDTTPLIPFITREQTDLLMYSV